MLVVCSVTNDITIPVINIIPPPMSITNSSIPKIISATSPRLFTTLLQDTIRICNRTKIGTMLLHFLIVLPILERLVYFRGLHIIYSTIVVFSFKLSVSPIRLTVGKTTGLTLACRESVLTNALIYGNTIARQFG